MPGFAEFYIQLKKAEAEAESKMSREMFWGLLADVVIGGVSGAVKGTGEALKHVVSDNMPHDYHIVKALRDIEKKL